MGEARLAPEVALSPDRGVKPLRRIVRGDFEGHEHCKKRERLAQLLEEAPLEGFARPLLLCQ